MRKVTAHTLSVFAAATAAGMTFTDVTVLLVRMTSAQVSAWKWISDAPGQDPVEGYEVRDTTGALLGVIVPLGHRAHRMHVEVYDPQTDDFYPAGETGTVITQGLARVIDQRTRLVGPVPAGDGFRIDVPRYLPARVNCLAGVCPDTCPDCEADHQRREADLLAWRAA